MHKRFHKGFNQVPNRRLTPHHAHIFLQMGRGRSRGSCCRRPHQGSPASRSRLLPPGALLLLLVLLLAAAVLPPDLGMMACAFRCHAPPVISQQLWPAASRFYRALRHPLPRHRGCVHAAIEAGEWVIVKETGRRARVVSKQSNGE